MSIADADPSRVPASSLYLSFFRDRTPQRWTGCVYELDYITSLSDLPLDTRGLRAIPQRL
jgi:hypothetical protein